MWQTALPGSTSSTLLPMCRENVTLSSFLYNKQLLSERSANLQRTIRERHRLEPQHLVDAMAFLRLQDVEGFGHHLGVILKERVTVALESLQTLGSIAKSGKLPTSGLARLLHSR
jgi:hypothetical protein